MAGKCSPMAAAAADAAAATSAGLMAATSARASLKDFWRREPRPPCLGPTILATAMRRAEPPPMPPLRHGPLKSS